MFSKQWLKRFKITYKNILLLCILLTKNSYTPSTTFETILYKGVNNKIPKLISSLENNHKFFSQFNLLKKRRFFMLT